MMPPTTAIDMIQMINQELERKHARHAHLRRLAVTALSAEPRPSRLSRLIVWAGVRQQPGS